MQKFEIFHIKSLGIMKSLQPYFLYIFLRCFEIIFNQRANLNKPFKYLNMIKVLSLRIKEQLKRKSIEENPQRDDYIEAKVSLLSSE